MTEPPHSPREVLICDALAPEALEVFAEQGIQARVATGLDEAALCVAAKDVAALVVRSATRVTRAVIEAAENLEVVGRAGVGVDNVDLEAATQHGVVVMNAPTGNTNTTAELAIAHLCALARHLPAADRSVRAGAWSKKGLMGTELRDKTLGIIGLGRIGRVVAERARGLAMHVVAHDPFLSGQKSPLEGVELTGLDDLLARADFVSLHLPLSDATRHVLGAEAIARMKPGARLINCARGGLVDETALVRALDEGRLRGAALDVLEQEPPAADHPLVGRGDVIVTPHLGASSSEAQRNVAVDIAQQISEFLLEGLASNAVNAPPLSRATLRAIAPYVLLAERIGSFLAGRTQGPVRALEVSLSGEIESVDARHVKLALLVGVLRASSDSPVNFVNAPRRAAEQGLEVVDVEEHESSFLPSLLGVRARGDHGSHFVAGTVYGREPRVVRIDDVALDLRPAGPMLITAHEDRPGVVGLIGTLLGEHGVNIRRVELAPPRGERELATGFFTLYDLPPEAVTDAIAQLEPIRKVELVHF